MNLEVREEKVRQAGGREITKTSKKLIFPRFHHWTSCAGSGKSNSIAWVAYRLASLHDGNAPIFTSVASGE